MSYEEIGEPVHVNAFVTGTANVGTKPPDEHRPALVVLALDMHGVCPNTAWEADEATARQLAAALLNAADTVERMTS